MPDKAAADALFRLFNEIGIIDQLTGAAFRDVLPRPLNQAMFGVLNHLVRTGDAKSPSSLANAFQVARPSMTATLAKLERAGCIDLRPDPDDSRGKRVFLTEEGRRQREEGVKAAQSLFGSIASQMEGFDVVELADTLGRLRAILDDARD